jgi:RecB family exonuclease
MTADPQRLFDEGEGLFEVNPSKLQCYLDCPRQYRFRYVDHRPERRSFAFTSVGRSVHKALRDFYALEPARRTLDVLLRLLRRAWDASGFRTQEEAEDRFSRAEAMLRRYFDDTDHARVRPLALESKFSVRDVNTRILVTGRVDRLDASDTGYVIVDYKTGSYRQDPRSVDESLPLSLYAMAVSGQFRQENASIVLHHLASGARWETQRDRARLAGDWKTLIDIVDEMRGQATFPARPGPLCRFCDYLAVCPEGRTEVGDRTEVAARRAPPRRPSAGPTRPRRSGR